MPVSGQPLYLSCLRRQRGRRKSPTEFTNHQAEEGGHPFQRGERTACTEILKSRSRRRWLRGHTLCLQLTDFLESQGFPFLSAWHAGKAPRPHHGVLYMGCSAQVVPDHVCGVRLQLKTSSDFCTATHDPFVPEVPALGVILCATWQTKTLHVMCLQPAQNCCCPRSKHISVLGSC